MVAPNALKAGSYSPPSNFASRKKNKRPVIIKIEMKPQRAVSFFLMDLSMPFMYTMTPAKMPPTAKVTMNAALE